MSESLLATAMIRVSGINGQESLVRALVDQCSQASFIKKSLVKNLNLPVYSVKLPVSGIGGNIAYTCSKVASFFIKPHFVSDFEMEVEAHILPKISGYNPNSSVKFKELNHLKN